MAAERDKFLGKDPFLYTQEQERFFKDLHQFHTNRGTAFLALPTVSGKKVDLYLLYSLVTGHGGFHKVSDKNLWTSLQTQLFHFPQGCANAELALKQMYMRYLYLYERVHVHGDDPDHREEEDTGEITRGGKSGGRILVHSVPMRYNYRQHRIGIHHRLQSNLSTSLVRANEYERLEKSLLSGLSNEVDFAINVCTVLSSEGRHSLRLFSHKRLIDVMLAQIGLFSENSTYRILYEKDWFPIHKKNFVKFWYQQTDVKSQEYSPSLLDLISTSECRERDINLYAHHKVLLGEDCLHLGADLGEKDVIYKRITQIVNIFRNLSFDVTSTRALAESDLFFRFVILCCHNKRPPLRRAGMDTISNMCQKYVLKAAHHPTTQFLFHIIHTWLQSKDKMELVNGLLMLVALAQTEQNEEILVESLTQEIYSIIVATARIYDLQLIIAALDALYYLSELGETTCEGISMVKFSVDFLVDLVTVETQSFGESALFGVRVLEHAPPPPAMPQPQSQRIQMSQMRPPPAPQPAPPTSVTHQPMGPPSNFQRAAAPQQVMASAQVGPYRNIQPKPSSMPQQPYQAIAPRPPGMLAATPQNLANMNPEQVACNWLRANYEQYPGTSVPANHVHRDYGVWLHRKGLQLPFLPPERFVACVRHVFPFANFTQNGTESSITGLRWKAHGSTTQSQTVKQPQPHQPIQTQQPALVAYPVGVAMSQSPLPPQRVDSPASISSSGLSPRIGSPPNTVQRVASPAVGIPPSNKGRDVLRDMLLSDDDPTQHKGKPKSRATSRRGSSPRPASALELQICGEVERVGMTLTGAMAKIERMENRSPGVTSAKSDKSDKLLDNATNGETPGEETKSSDKQGNGEKDSPPSTTLSSPVLCNGNHSDSDSVHQNGLEDGRSLRKRPANGMPPEAKPKKMQRNGLINGMEKIVDTITEDRRAADRQRQASGDSQASISSISTILSSVSSNHTGNGSLQTTKKNNHKSVDETRNCMSPGSDTRTNSDHSNPAVSCRLKPNIRKSDSNNSISMSNCSNDTITSRHDVFHCGWAECTTSCESRSMLRRHVSKVHTDREGSCRWVGCDNLYRKRWSLVSHVSEKHTNDAALLKSQKTGVKGFGTSMGAPAIYTAAAAKLAIMRGFPKPPYQDLMDGREGPVTKHIRFTSSLILRNLARYSPHGRTLLKKHESRLVCIAGSAVEAAGTISNCLWELHQNHS